jgi:hypothetical protein
MYLISGILVNGDGREITVTDQELTDCGGDGLMTLGKPVHIARLVGTCIQAAQRIPEIVRDQAELAICSVIVCG